MAATTRPYICVYNGVTRMVDAKDPGAVVRHVVGAAVTELRPARGGEVSAWAREGKEIEVAGVTPAATVDDTAASAGADVKFTIDDASQWFSEGMGIEEDALMTDDQMRAVAAFKAAASEGRMTLMHFDEMRAAVPAFGEAVLNGIASDGTMDGVRAAIEEEPVAFDEVVDIIADRKQKELFYADPADGGDKMVGNTGHIDA